MNCHGTGPNRGLAYRGYHLCCVEDHYDALTIRRMAQWGMNRILAGPMSFAATYEKTRPYGIVPDTTTHTFATWLPLSEFFRAHPEYFPLQGGKRRPTGQLCVSNPEVVAIIAERMRLFARQNPDADIIGVGPNDGHGWCECERCVAMDPPEERKLGEVSTRAFTFFNMIAERVTKDFPGRLVGTSAYNQHMNPPRGLKVIHPHLEVALVVGLCYKHRINDPRCERNAVELERCRGWLQKTRNLHFYEYFCSSTWNNFPTPVVKTQIENVRVMQDLGIKGFIAEIIPGEWFAANELRLYAYAKAAKDANLSFDQILDAYIRETYGQGARSMRAYHLALEDSVAAMAGHFPGGPERLEDLLNRKTVSACKEALETARREAPSNRRILEEQRRFHGWLEVLKARSGMPVRTDVLTTVRAARLPGLKDAPSAAENRETFVERSTLTIPADKTTVTASYDDKNLYLRFECQESHPERIRATVTERDGDLWDNDDNVEIYVERDPTSKPRRYYQFIVNPIGARFDAEYVVGQPANYGWDAAWKCKAEVDRRAWRALVSIPWAAVGLDPKAGDTIRINFTRAQRTLLPVGGALFSGWPHGAFHDPERFGILKLK